MGFGTIGHPSGELTNENIKFELKMYLSIWLFELNAENYNKNVFSLDLRKFTKSKIELTYNESNTSLIDNQRNINKHIIWELKSVNGLIEWIESIFDFYELDLFDIEMYKNQFEIKDKNQNSSEITNFIFTYKNNNSKSEMKKSVLINEKIDECTEREILYFCINMYLDFSKIEEFLKGKFNHNLPKEIKLQKPDNTKLSLNGLALKYFYEGIFINRENANKYLEGTGHTSGDALYNDYIKWSDKQNRKSDPEGKVKLKNKIKLFETVIDLLPENKKAKAIDELNIIKSYVIKYQ
jgi:hypothetical protein